MTEQMWKWAAFIVLTLALGTGVYTGKMPPESLIAVATYLLGSPLAKKAEE